MRSVLLILAVLVIGCGGKTRDSGPTAAYAAVGRANVAVILGSIDLDLPELGPSEEPKGTPLETATGDDRPVVTVFAPEYRPDSGPFLDWLETADLDSLPFRLEISEEIPADVTIYPTFRWDGGEQTGFDGVESLKNNVAAFQPQPVPVQGKKNKEKRDHDLVNLVGQASETDILGTVIGEGISIRRTALIEVKIPLGYGANLIVPPDVEFRVTKSGEETVAEAVKGNPKVLLPVLRKLWPVSVERMRLSGDTLVVEMDGWKDLTIKVGQ